MASMSQFGASLLTRVAAFLPFILLSCTHGIECRPFFFPFFLNFSEFGNGTSLIAALAHAKAHYTIDKLEDLASLVSFSSNITGNFG